MSAFENTHNSLCSPLSQDDNPVEMSLHLNGIFDEVKRCASDICTGLAAAVVVPVSRLIPAITREAPKAWNRLKRKVVRRTSASERPLSSLFFTISCFKTAS